MPATILQTNVAAYRMPVFQAVAGLLGEFRVVAGDRYFTPNLETVAYGEPWFEGITNTFLLRNKFCWQNGVKRLLAKDEAVIAELNPRILSTWRLFLARRLAKKRSLFWGHVHGRGQRGLAFRIIRRSMLKLCDGVVSYTHSDAKVLKDSGFQKPIWVTQNSCVSELDCRPVNGSQSDFVYVGRLVSDKKVDLLIRSLPLVLPKFPDCQLQILGDGPTRPELESLTRDLKLTERVHFWGMTSEPAQIRTAYENCVAAASPGYVGLSAIQAMSYGVPILVAKDEPHAPEVEACDEGKTALFFESDDPSSMAASMLSVLESRSRWSEERPAISQFVRENYTIEHMARVLASALEGKAFP